MEDGTSRVPTATFLLGIKLTGSQATWVVHDMNVEQLAAVDPSRKEKLLEFREAIATNYLYPLDDSTAIYE